MLAVNYTNLRDSMKSYMDKVTEDYETIIVTRKDNRNVVMMSEEAYDRKAGTTKREPGRILEQED